MTVTVVPSPSPQLLKSKEAARSLAISERSLWALSQAGDIQTVKIGRSVRYSPEALAAFIERQSGKQRRK